MANDELVASRRDEIGQRWLRGQSVATIARETGVPVGTVRHDLETIHQELLRGQGDVLRMARSRTMATIELVTAHAWERVEQLQRQAEPDEQAVLAYLTLVLKAEMQTAKIAGLIVSQPDQVVQQQVVNRDLHTWIEERDPTAAARKAHDRMLNEMLYGTLAPPPSAAVAALAKPRRGT